jgi:hypothetical protein
MIEALPMTGALEGRSSIGGNVQMTETGALEPGSANRGSRRAPIQKEEQIHDRRP